MAWYPPTKRPSSTVDNHLGVTGALSIGPSEAMEPTTSAVVLSVGSSTYNPNAYDGQSLTAQWMATMSGVLTVMSFALYWLQGQPVPLPPGYAASSHLPTLPSGAWGSFGAHNVFRQSPQWNLGLAWGVQGRQGHLFT